MQQGKRRLKTCSHRRTLQVDGAAAIRVDLLSQQLDLSLGRVLAQRAHHGAQLGRGDAAVVVLGAGGGGGVGVGGGVRGGARSGRCRTLWRATLPLLCRAAAPLRRARGCPLHPQYMQRSTAAWHAAAAPAGRQPPRLAQRRRSGARTNAALALLAPPRAATTCRRAAPHLIEQGKGLLAVGDLLLVEGRHGCCWLEADGVQVWGAETDEGRLGDGLNQVLQRLGGGRGALGNEQVTARQQKPGDRSPSRVGGSFRLGALPPSLL